MIITLLERMEGENAKTDVVLVLRHDEAQAVLDGSRGPMAVRLERIRETAERNGERLENIDSICVISADASLLDDESVSAAMTSILGREHVEIVDHRRHAPARN